MANKILDDRVSGVQFELARHPRVEVASVRLLLQKKPSPALCVEESSLLHESLPLIAGGATLIVVAGGTLRGTLCAQDFARARLTLGERSDACPVGAAMSACARSARTSETVEDCLRLMRENNVRFLPVLDSGKVLALLTLERLLEEKVAYLESVCKERELDQQIAFLRGTYSC